MATSNPDQPDFQVTRVEIAATAPNAGELRKIRARARDAAERTESTYLVKIYLSTLPKPAGTGYELWIGDRRIRKYTQFRRGIFFKLYDRESLQTLAGAPLRFRREGDDGFLPWTAESVMPSAAGILRSVGEAKALLKSRREALDE